MQKQSNLKTILFVVCICFLCAFTLSVISSALKQTQLVAKELDQSKELLIAAKILSVDGYFLIDYIKPAIYDPAKKILTPGPIKKASNKDILTLYQARITPMLTNDKGNLISFTEAKVNLTEYIEDNQKRGYAHLPLKLLYVISPNESNGKPAGYVIPINGFGLWDAIYGYLALESNADTVIGTTWYDQKETAGLGANIALPSFQKQFFGKVIFQESPSGSTDFQTTPIGINVIKGKVSEVLGSSPKAKSSVDGISGATLTSQGVTSAYHQSLAPYRPFLIKAKGSSD